jgi:lysophosphatidylcholine acyltransferase / lyso-PAF acetyltransferase
MASDDPIATTAARSESDSVGAGGGMRSEEAVAARPLLSPPSPLPTVAAPARESVEELDRRYAPYTRRDAYGPMGVGPVGAAEAARLSIASVVLIPLRLVAGVLVAYYLVCRVCTLRVEEEREGGGEGDGYARLEGWRREVVVRCGRALTRAMMFVFGFYWIREYDCRCLHAEVVNAE